MMYSMYVLLHTRPRHGAMMWLMVHIQTLLLVDGALSPAG